MYHNENTVTTRVSCSGLVRIVLDGEYLGCLHQHQLRGGKRVCYPIGGALHYQGRETKHFLCDDIGAVFESGKDLRFSITCKPSEIPDKLTKVERWFRLRQGRETDISREIYEELIQEHCLISANDRVFRSLQFLAIRTMYGETHRKGHEGQPTHYFFELYNAPLSRAATARLLRSLERQVSPIHRLLSPHEIDQGITADGIFIASSFRHFLEFDN